MIHSIRKLARAVHRRSVWQVLAAYLVGSWAVLECVGWFTLAVGLPGWTPTLTTALIVVLLPLVVATAAAQGGLPGLRIEDEVDPNELIGLTPEQVHVIPEEHPLYDQGLLTWRNVILGGVSSAALLVASVVAYMTMWALGIGPVGSLLGQGVIEQQDAVLVAGVLNHTDDASLEDLLGDVFALELSRSNVVSVTQQGQGDPALIVSVEASRQGDRYVIASRVAMPDGTVVARFEDDASDADLLLAAVRLTERVRERLGESLRAVREAERLAPVASGSEEALDRYRQAGRAAAAGDLPTAIEHLSESVRADPSFAVGWHKLGTLAEQAGDRRAAVEAYQAVVDLWAPSGAAGETVSDLRGRIARLD